MQTLNSPNTGAEVSGKNSAGQTKPFLISHTYRSLAQSGVVCGECDRKSQTESSDAAVLSEESKTSICNLRSSTLTAPGKMRTSAFLVLVHTAFTKSCSLVLSARLGEPLIPEASEDQVRSRHEETHAG